MSAHRIDVRVYYEHTDAGGVVYHANYLKFAEQARTELLRSAGFENKSLGDDQGILFVVRHISADYLKPAHLDDLLYVKTSIAELKNASIVMKQQIYRGETIVFSADVTVVCVDTNGYKPVRLPDNLRQGFENYA